MARRNMHDPGKRSEEDQAVGPPPERGEDARGEEAPEDTVREATASSRAEAEPAAQEAEASGEGAAGQAGDLSDRERREQLRRILGDRACEDLLAAQEKTEMQAKILEEKDKLLKEYEDLLKRKQAEFENYRKRVQKELEDYRKYATSELVLDILNTIDDFERAIDSAKSSRDLDMLLDGIMLVEKQLRNILEKKHGVEKIETVGREFDPTVHDAIMMEESGDHEEDTVVEAFQSGYRMHDRVLRPAKVKVAKAVSGGEQDQVNETRESSGKGE